VSLADADGTVILVEDTNQALLDLARFKRDTLSGTFISITGSNGKTTTKELLAAMMKKRHGVHFNEKNLNNLIGVPMSILSIAGDPDICILELGTNMPGEIRKLAVATDPDASLITNVNPSHLEGLTSLEGLLEETLDLFRYMREGGTVFVTVDDPGLAAAGAIRAGRPSPSASTMTPTSVLPSLKTSAGRAPASSLPPRRGPYGHGRPCSSGTTSTTSSPPPR
jgi:UDP-N-acetylmuramoyl-tripeptide--D-alanyl-D-alanine ligase